ncbi:MAG: YkgJ family cysteine cluster protein [Lacibacter sp.]
MQLQLSLQAIQETATAKQEQNDRFIQHLKQLNQEELDAEVQRLDQLISPQISCTDCGNCCKGLMVNITAEEADRASAHLHMSREAFDEKYVEK